MIFFTWQLLFDCHCSVTINNNCYLQPTRNANRTTGHDHGLISTDIIHDVTVTRFPYRTLIKCRAVIIFRTRGGITGPRLKIIFNRALVIFCGPGLLGYHFNRIFPPPPVFCYHYHNKRQNQSRQLLQQRPRDSRLRGFVSRVSRNDPQVSAAGWTFFWIIRIVPFGKVPSSSSFRFLRYVCYEWLSARVRIVCSSARFIIWIIDWKCSRIKYCPCFVLFFFF